MAKLHQFLCMLPVAVARSSSDDVVICHVLPVLWMTSCFHTMGLMGQNHARCNAEERLTLLVEHDDMLMFVILLLKRCFVSTNCSSIEYRANV